MPGFSTSSRVAGALGGACLLVGLFFLPVQGAFGASPVSLSSITPISGAPGSTVTLTGSGFSAARSLVGFVGSTPVALSIATDSQASLVVPLDAMAGSTTVAVVVDGVAAQPTFSFTVLVLAPLATPIEAGGGYSTHLVVSGGKAPYTFSFAAGTLPPGLGLSAEGTISGVPLSIGSTSFVLAAVDANQLTASFPVTLAVSAGPSIATATLPVGETGTSYLAELQASGGTPPYTWSIASGAVPGGLVLSSTGIVSGIPRAATQTTIALRVTDSLGSSALRTVSYLVRQPPVGVVLATATGATEAVSTTAPVVLTAPTGVAPAPVAVASSADGSRVWLVSATGAVTPLGSTPLLGGLVGPPRRPVVAIVADGSGSGYFVVTAAGRVYGFGVRQHGSLSRAERSGSVVAIAATNDGGGYLLVTSSGKVDAFGNAPALGSIRRSRLRGRVVGIALTRGGRGYFVATSSGHVYAFGSARSAHVAAPRVTGRVVGITAAPSGVGYWLVTALGAVVRAGSAPALHALPTPPGIVVGLATAS